MGPESYANQIRQLKALEIRNQADYTERAVTVYNLRVASIDQGPGTEQQKERLREKAATQYRAFMGRDLPEPPSGDPEIDAPLFGTGNGRSENVPQ
uniref:Uncharacterized protein n=1 Tax=uncultured prokaryote TaxID=198431 RepID=A0A0H5Q3F4_9ZZZZ|nr:hypothetical protein [uncultured prokaryote]